MSPSQEKIVTLEGITAEKKENYHFEKMKSSRRIATALSDRRGGEEGGATWALEDESPDAEIVHSGSEDVASVLSTDSMNGIFNDTL